MRRKQKLIRGSYTRRRYTHKGVMIDHNGKAHVIWLRELKLWWASEGLAWYSKETGMLAGKGKDSLERLDLTTIARVEDL
ncbi:hypothetical protein [Hafnia phage yong3]|nr:hypothetical protein [Hafnia phage yong3]